jgi:hypothetical protein
MNRPSPFRIDPDRTPRQLRIDGALLVALCLFILGITGLVAGAHLGLYDPAALLPGSITTEPSAPAPTSLGTKLLVLLVVVFALAGVAEGAWRLVHGTRNRVLMRVLIGIAITLFVIGAIAMMLQGERIHVRFR